MVFASVQPAIRTMFKRDLKRSQDPIEILHHIRARESQDCKSKVALHPAISDCIAVRIVGVPIDFDHKPFCRAEEIDDPRADNSLTPKLVSQEPTITQCQP